MICWQNPKVLKLWTTFHYHVGLPGNRYNFAIFQSYELYGTRSIPRTFPASAASLMAVDLRRSPTESMKLWRQSTRLKSTCPNLLVCSALAWGWEWNVYIYIPLHASPCKTVFVWLYIISSDHMQSPSCSNRPSQHLCCFNPNHGVGLIIWILPKLRLWNPDFTYPHTLQSTNIAGTWIIWRCISYRKWWIFQLAMLVYRSGRWTQPLQETAWPLCDEVDHLFSHKIPSSFLQHLKSRWLTVPTYAFSFQDPN